MQIPSVLQSLAIQTARKFSGIPGLTPTKNAALLEHILPMDIKSLLASAQRRTGLSNFGDDAFYEGLTRLLHAYRTDAKLSLIGWVAARQDLVHLLSTRLELEGAAERHPEILAKPIKNPIFIMGMPRTGTTLLHSLLAQDPAHRAPLSWQVMFPNAPRAETSADPKNRVRKTAEALSWLDHLAPDFARAHHVGAEEPQECIGITALAFESPRFHTTHNLPSYQAWLAHRDTTQAYAYHKQVLQHLQWRQPAKRWVLKAPSHLHHLKEIFRVYPDALIVQTHRDPREVLPSTASLTAMLYGAFSDQVDLTMIGREVLERWALGVNRAQNFRDRHPDLAHRFIDIQYKHLVQDPIGAANMIYSRFGISLDIPAQSRMREFVANNPQHKFGKHSYSLDQFGLTDAEITQQFSSYFNYLENQAAA